MESSKIIIIVLIVLFFSCETTQPRNGFDFLIFNDTSVEELARAVEKQDIATIKNLIRTGSPVNYQDPIYHQTLLAVAAVNFKNESVKALLEMGANPDIRTDDSSALEQISGEYVCNPEAARMMVDRGAKLNTNVYTGQILELTPLEKTCMSGCKELFYFYIQAGAKIDTSADSRLLNLALANINDLEYLNFLILKKNCRAPYPSESKVVQGKRISFADKLNNIELEFGSKNWQYREEILTFIKTKGWE